MKPITTTALVQAVLQYDKPIRNSHRLVLIAIANRYNSKTGQCNPNRETIAKDAQTSIRTVERAIEEARDAKILSWVKLSFNGRRPNNSYCWQGLCENALPPWTGNPDTHAIAGQSTTADKKDIAQKVNNQLSKPVAFDICGEMLHEWSKEGSDARVNAEMTARYIQQKRFNETDATLFIKQAMHIAPYLWDSDNDEGTPALAYLLGRAVEENWRYHINFSWKIDTKHDKQKVMNDHNQIR